MYYVDMDNILCSNCNFQEINRMKHRKIIKNTNLKKHFTSNSGIFAKFLNKIWPLNSYFSMNSMELDLKYGLQHNNWS